MNLQINSVSFNYGDVKVLDKISFNASRGQIVGIIGPNGSGKTTLIRCIAGILKPRQGTIYINQKNTQEYKRKELAQILSVVPQINTFTQGFTVFDTVLMGRYPHLGLYQRERERDYRILDFLPLY